MAKAKKGSPQGTGNTAAVCYRLAQPAAAELGLSLWDVRFIKEGASWYLRIYIDKEDTDISIDDCVAMSRKMDKLLDEADPISQSYCLEVCSPGIERELTRPEHFTICEGWPVLIKLIHPADGIREVTGILQGFADNIITIQTENGDVLSFQKKETSSVHLIDEWNADDYGGETENE